jgi:hypothetical protein
MDELDKTLIDNEMYYSEHVVGQLVKSGKTESCVSGFLRLRRGRLTIADRCAAKPVVWEGWLWDRHHRRLGLM